jgi:hypothetical protein
MSAKTLNELVRDQILAEGPDIASSRDQWTCQEQYNLACDDYVDGILNSLTNVGLLERISAAHEVLDAKLLEQVKSWL